MAITIQQFLCPLLMLLKKNSLQKSAIFQAPNPIHISLPLKSKQRFERRTDTRSMHSNFCMLAGGVLDRKMIYVYRRRHEWPVVYLALVYLAGRQSPRIAAQLKYVIQGTGSDVSASHVGLFHLNVIVRHTLTSSRFVSKYTLYLNLLR